MHGVIPMRGSDTVTRVDTVFVGYTVREFPTVEAEAECCSHRSVLMTGDVDVIEKDGVLYYRWVNFPDRHLVPVGEFDITVSSDGEIGFIF